MKDPTGLFHIAFHKCWKTAIDDEVPHSGCLDPRRHYSGQNLPLCKHYDDDLDELG